MPLWRRLLYLDDYPLLLVASVIDAALAVAVIKWGVLHAPLTVDMFLHEAGIPFVVASKLLIISVFVILCEHIGRRRPTTGRRVVWLGTVVTVITSAIMLMAIYRG